MQYPLAPWTRVVALLPLALLPSRTWAGVQANLEIMVPDTAPIRLSLLDDGNPTPLASFYDTRGQRWDVLADLDVRGGSAFLTVRARSVSPHGKTLAYVIRDAHTPLDGATSLSLGPSRKSGTSAGDLQIEVELLPDVEGKLEESPVLSRSAFAEVARAELVLSPDASIASATCDGDDVEVVGGRTGLVVRTVHPVDVGDQSQFTCQLTRSNGQVTSLPVLLSWY